MIFGLQTTTASITYAALTLASTLIGIGSLIGIKLLLRDKRRRRRVNTMDDLKNPKAQKKLTIILDRANLEPIKVAEGRYEFLNCDQHMPHIRRLRKDPAFCRPDIVHQCLLTLSESPLNRAGLLQIYVRTDTNALIKLDPQLAIPRHFDDFTRVFMKLIQELKSIRAVGNSKQLAKLVRNPVTAHLPVGCVKYALSSKATNLVHPVELVPKDEDQLDNVALVIGAMAHEQVTPDYVDRTYSISEFPLSAALVCAKVTSAFEHQWQVGHAVQVPLAKKSILKHLAAMSSENTTLSSNKKVNGQCEPTAAKRQKSNVDDLHMNIRQNINEDNDEKPLDVWFDGVDPKLIEMHCNQRTIVSATEEHLTSVADETVDRTAWTKEVAIDCEMVECNYNKSVLARISIVNSYGHPLYDKFVEPPSKVTDYRTPYSGIRRQDLLNAPTFEQVQGEVRDLLKGRIVVGHALHNDLGVLQIDHPKSDIRDTSRYFKSYFQGKTPSLKKLSQCLLGIRVQEGEHCSVQDAQATMRLYMSHREKWSQVHDKIQSASTPGVNRKPHGKKSKSKRKTKAKSHKVRQHLMM